MNAVLGHLIVHSAGLVVVASAAWLARLAWRRHPSACYRLLMGLLGAVLVLPLIQIGVEGVRASGEPGPSWWRVVVDGVGNEEAAVVPSEPAPPLAAGVSAEPEPSRKVFVRRRESRTRDHPSRLPPSEDDRAEDHSVLAQVPAPAEASLVVPPSAPRDPRPLLFFAYVAGLAVAGAFAFRRVRRARGIVRKARPCRDPFVLAAWRKVTGSRRSSRNIRLLESDDVEAPACWGWRRPVILVPPASDRRPTPAALRCALLHELVHLDRGDGVTALLQHVMTSLFWFHPAAWWLTRELDTFRELSCDAEVVRRTGSRRRYADALLDYAVLMVPAARPCPSLIPWSRSGRSLRRRIEMLIASREPSSTCARSLALLGAFGVAAVVWMGQIAIAATLFPGDQQTAPTPLAVPVAPLPPVASSSPQEEPPPAPPAPRARPRGFPLPRPAAAPLPPEPGRLPWRPARPAPEARPEPSPLALPGSAPAPSRYAPAPPSRYMPQEEQRLARELRKILRGRGSAEKKLDRIEGLVDRGRRESWWRRADPSMPAPPSQPSGGWDVATAPEPSRLRAEGGFELYFWDEKGQPVEDDVKVRVLDDDRRLVAVVDPKGGMARLKGLAPGQYRIRVEGAEIDANDLSITVLPGKDQRLEMVFARKRSGQQRRDTELDELQRHHRELENTLLRLTERIDALGVGETKTRKSRPGRER